MDNELRYFLEQGPTTVKELARVTGKSVSTIYKALKDESINREHQNGDPKAPMVFWMVPVPAVEANQAIVGDRGPEVIVPPSSVAPAPSTGVRGRKATAAGQKLFPGASLLGGDEPQTYVNPRRKGSHGFRSLQIIIDNPGITTEDYLAKGGRLNDLRWDLAHGNVKAE